MNAILKVDITGNIVTLTSFEMVINVKSVSLLIINYHI